MKENNLLQIIKENDEEFEEKSRGEGYKTYIRFKRHIEKSRIKELEAILDKINKDYKNRDITIYELGDWIEDTIKQLKN